MQRTAIFSNFQANDANIANRIDLFFDKLSLGRLAARCGITKSKGISPRTLLMTLFALPFLGQNIFRGVARNNSCQFGKDAVYDFLGSSRFSWRRLLLMVAIKATAMLDALTGSDRETVLILDDTSIHRPRAKKVELLARLYDHCENRFLKGFRMLTLAWSDGASLVPLDFALLSSTDPCNRYQGVTKDLDRRSCGAKRRREAVTKSTALLAPMVRRALEAGGKARYLLMDSWFGMPAIISALRPLIPVICMVKRTPKVLYGFQGKRLSLDGIYRVLKKRRGRAKILSSAVVAMNNGEPARIVFVRDRRKKDWLALLTTDINLPDEEVIRIYGKRWDIEVFFRTAKQFLQLEKGSQARDFDTLIAHSTIVLMRYIFLALEQRRLDDPRSLGLLFHACCDEMRDVTYLESLKRILELAMAQISPKDRATTDIYAALAEAILGQAILYFGLQGSTCQRSLAIAA
jgi:hypothetical protein